MKIVGQSSRALNVPNQVINYKFISIKFLLLAMLRATLARYNCDFIILSELMTNFLSSETSKEMEKIFDEADRLYSEVEVQSAINAVAAEISAKIANKNPLVLTVMNGGLVFAGQLLTKITFPLEIDYIHATRYGDETIGKSLNWIAKPKSILKDRCVLLIDDILDEGNTLLEIIQYCRSEGASEILTAVLVDKKHDRKADQAFKADFTGLEVEDRFIFGYGMDYKGYWRNAPGIFAVKGM